MSKMNKNFFEKFQMKIECHVDVEFNKDVPKDLAVIEIDRYWKLKWSMHIFELWTKRLQSNFYPALPIILNVEYFKLKQLSAHRAP